MSHPPDHQTNGQTDGEVSASPGMPEKPTRPLLPLLPLRRSPLATAWYAATRESLPRTDAAPVAQEPSPEMAAMNMSSLKANADQELEVPAYKLHPMDMYLIREAADKMNLSVAEYAQLAPFLYAKFMRDVGW